MSGGYWLAAVALGLSGVAWAATPVPAPTPSGKALFDEKCSMCHGARGMGTFLLSRRMPAAQAPLETRSDLTADYVVQAARSGIGNMPRIPRGEVSDRQLAAIAAYLAKEPGK